MNQQTRQHKHWHPFGIIPRPTWLFQQLAFMLLLPIVLPTTANAQQPQIDLNQFDSWIFQSHGRDETQARKGLIDKIELEFVRIEQTTPLTEEQKEQVRLAGRGDIKRFFDRVNKAREEFLDLQESDKGKANQNDINEAYQLASPLQQELSQGLFDEESLMKKVVRGVMTEDQSEKLEKRLAEQRRLMTEINIKMYLATLGRNLALTAKQQRQLLAILTKSVKPFETEDNNRFIYYLIPFHLAQISEDEKAEIMDATQIEALKKVTKRAEGMKAMLKQQGLIE